MRVRVAIPDRTLDQPTLDALLEATTRAGERQLARGDAPDFRDSLESGAIRWHPERFVDGEHFDLPAVAARRRWGDCDDLGPWYAASLRTSGDDPGARAVARRSGAQRWHVVVRRSDGRIEDPSRMAGMAVSGVGASVRALAARPMSYRGDGAVAITRGRDGLVPWWARVDLPWHRGHVATVAPGRSPQAALTRAVMGALDTSDRCSRDHAHYADLIAGDLLYPEGKGSYCPPLATLLDEPKGGQVALAHGNVAWHPRGDLIVRF